MRCTCRKFEVGDVCQRQCARNSYFCSVHRALMSKTKKLCNYALVERERGANLVFALFVTLNRQEEECFISAIKFIIWNACDWDLFAFESITRPPCDTLLHVHNFLPLVKPLAAVNIHNLDLLFLHGWSVVIHRDCIMLFLCIF